MSPFKLPGPFSESTVFPSQFQVQCRPCDSPSPTCPPGYKRTSTSLNWILLLCGLITKLLIRTLKRPRVSPAMPINNQKHQEQQGLIASSYLHSCHPGCANTSTAEPQLPHPGDKHFAQSSLLACPRVALQVWGQTQAELQPPPTGVCSRHQDQAKIGQRRPRAALLWEHTALWKEPTLGRSRQSDFTGK